MLKRKPHMSKTTKPKRSARIFEQAFYNRLGQTPSEFISTKLSVGSDIKATQYLYEITAAAIAQNNNCAAVDFYYYYVPEQKEEKKVTKTTKYNKLVRDRIPEIIRDGGKNCVTEVLSDSNYLEMLDAKLQEELDEYKQSKSLEELADLLEVMGAVVKARGYTWDELTRIRKEKLAKRGGFEKKILLKEVTEEK